MRRTSSSHPELRLLLACSILAGVPALSAAGDAASKGRASTPAPDGVCYPVNGSGYVVTRAEGLKIPIGTLSPLVEGDSLVVESGTITFLDFRTGQSPVYGAGTRLTIPPVKRPKRPLWWQRLEDHIVRSLSGPELERIGGSVRSLKTAAFWPDSARFAPEVPFVFEWSGVHPPPVRLQIVTAGGATEQMVDSQSAGRGVHVWHPESPLPAGEVSWTLFDEDGETLGGGRFTVLAPETAAAERLRYQRAAGETAGGEPQGLTAVVLAEADRAYLW